MLFFGLVFAVSALALFVVAFSQVSKGRIGGAVVFGVAAVLMSGIAGAVLVYGD